MVGEGGEVAASRQYDWAEKDPSAAIVEVIADVEGTEPVALGVTLHDHVDTDALDELVSGGTDVSVSFTLDGYRVRIDGNTLVVTDG